MADPAVTPAQAEFPSITTPTPEAKAPATPITTPAPEPLYKGLSGHINSQDELIAYAKRMEEEVIQSKIEKQHKPSLSEPITPTNTVPIEPVDGFEQLIYTNPIKAKELLKNEIREEFRTNDLKKEQEKKFWSEFYTENSDLKPMDRIVQLTLKDKWSEVEKLPLNQAKEVLAKAAREVVGLVRSSVGVTETTLPSGGAVTLGSSGSPAPKAPVIPPKEMTMSEQLLQFRRNKSVKK